MYSNLTQASPLKNSFKKALSILSLAVILLTVFAATVQANAAAITSFDVVQTSFNPDNQVANINFSLNQTGSITLEVFEGSNPIKTLAFRQPVSAGSYNYTWDGRKTDGTKVAAGTYKVQLFYYSETFALFADDSVTVTYSGSGTTPDPDPDPVSNVVTNLYDSPDPFDPDKESTNIYYTLTRPAYVTLHVENSSGTIVRNLLDNAYRQAGSTSASWNGLNNNGQKQPEGKYRYVLIVTGDFDIQRYSGYVNIVYTGDPVVSPVISSDYASPTPFDPYKTNTYVYFTLNTQADVTLQIYSGSNLVNTLMSKDTVSAGSHSKLWNGRNSSNNVVAEGIYTYTITATNAKGTYTKSGLVEVLYTDSGILNPQISNANVSPRIFDPSHNESTTISFTVNTCVYMTANVYRASTNTFVKTLEESLYICSGSKTVTWDGRNASGNIAGNGDYYIRIAVHNSKGSDFEEKTVTVVSDQGTGTTAPLLTDIYVDPYSFRPQNNESTTFRYRLNTCADVSVKVYDSNNYLVNTLRNNINQCSGTYSITWNGRNSSNNIVSDGIYVFKIWATNSAGSDYKTADARVRHYTEEPYTSPRCVNYIDVSETNPYCIAITYVTNLNIFSGYPDGSFQPYEPINRAETTKVILLGFNYSIMSADGTKLGFFDVDPNAWYMPYLRTAKHYGIIQGYPDGSFRPANTVNRVELLKVFLETSKVHVPACTHQPYPDTPINEWYSKYVCYSKTYGLMDTDYYGNFNPAAPMKRGDVAELFYRFYTKGLNQYTGTTTVTVTGAPQITNVSLSDDLIRQGQNMTISYRLNVVSDVTVQILNKDNAVVRTLVNDVNQAAGTHSTIWNSKDSNGYNVAEGSYKVKIRASNAKGSDTYLAGIEVDNSAVSTSLRITALDINRAVWNPVTQGSLAISFRTNMTSTVSVAIYDHNNDLVRNLWTSVSKTAGLYEILWNGRDRYNNLVPDGIYTIKVTAKTGSETVQKEISVEVDR